MYRTKTARYRALGAQNRGVSHEYCEISCARQNRVYRTKTARYREQRYKIRVYRTKTRRYRAQRYKIEVYRTKTQRYRALIISTKIKLGTSVVKDVSSFSNLFYCTVSVILDVKSNMDV